MDSISGSSAYNLQSSSANPAQGTQAAAVTHPTRHARSLTFALLSDRALTALNVKETQGSDQEKMLAGFAQQAIESGQLQLSPNQPPNGIAQFGMQRNQAVLVIQAKLNERSNYDVLSVGFREGSETPISMTLSSPSAAVARTAQHSPALLSLPNELLLHIAGGTGDRGEGVNLSLRRVNKRIKVIADDQMSAKQRFVIENGQTLKALGFEPFTMRDLADLPEDQQNFVLTHGKTLQALGFGPYDMEILARQPEDQRDFVLIHGETLQTLEFQPLEMRFLARQPEDRKNFVLTHGQTLRTLGFMPYDIQDLVDLTEDQRNFVLTHGETLQALGHSPLAMEHLACRPEDQQNFVLTHGQTLNVLGYTPARMHHLADQPPAQRDVILQHAGYLA